MILWLAPEPLLLASQSAIRRTLLTSAGVAVDVQAADIDERAIEARAALSGAGDVAGLLAREKALSVAAGHSSRVVLGADQTLTLNARRFSKAKDRAGAREQLSMLRGKTHTLHSAVAVWRGHERLYEHVDAAHLTMRHFSDDFLERYLDAAGAAAMSSVGGYQLEGLGIQLFEKVEGDHSTVLGLPLLPLLRWLRSADLLAT